MNEQGSSIRESLHAASQNSGAFRWRRWPCPSCGGGCSPVDYLGRGIEAGGVLSDIAWHPEEVIASQVRSLSDWILSCPHTEEESFPHSYIAAGSEHLVFVEEPSAAVWKLTRTNVFGELYYLEDGRVSQRNCSPVEYLARLEQWEVVFGDAPKALGIAKSGQIVSRHKFIRGRMPTQAQIDSFLERSGFVPVKQSCWLWRSADPEINVWLGDARTDNFVETPEGEIVPIDVRLWRPD